MKTYRFEHIEKRIPGDAVDALTFINGQVGVFHKEGWRMIFIECSEQSVPGVYNVYLKFRKEVEAA